MHTARRRDRHLYTQMKPFLSNLILPFSLIGELRVSAQDFGGKDDVEMFVGASGQRRVVRPQPRMSDAAGQPFAVIPKIRTNDERRFGQESLRRQVTEAFLPAHRPRQKWPRAAGR